MALVLWKQLFDDVKAKDLKDIVTTHCFYGKICEKTAHWMPYIVTVNINISPV